MYSKKQQKSICTGQAQLGALEWCQDIYQIEKLFKTDSIKDVANYTIYLQEVNHTYEQSQFDQAEMP